jgi:hypothetical protein
MPIIYLEHPVYGHKVAISDQEAEYDEQNGWQRYTPGETAVNELVLTPRRRRKEMPDGYSRGTD